MKQFNIDEAKAGKPVCTRDGRDVRLICFDFKTHRRDYPLVALIKDGDMETLSEYSADGKSIMNRSEYDLFMKTVVKLEGYVNVFDFAGKPAVFSQVYATEQKAKEIGEKNSRYYVGTAKIVMEE